MILKTSIHMTPLLIGITASVLNFQSTDMVFNEKDIKNNLITVDIDPIRYNNVINSFGYDDVYIKDRIRNYINKWNFETLILSDIHAITRNDNFQQIISLGNKAVPYILNELKETPSPLIWALNIILDKKISNGNVSINDASKAWVKWGIQNRIIEA